VATELLDRRVELDTDDSVEARAVAALLTCVARTGWTKTTFDDIAREAGCSRATLYRRCSGKAALLQATLESERVRFGRELLAATHDATTLEDACVAVLTTATQMLRDHAALQFLLAFEPEVILPHLTFSAGDTLLVESGNVVAPALTPFLDVGDAPRTGEWLARTVFVYLNRPNTPFDLSSEAGARVLVREFLLPAFTHLSVRS